MQAVCTYGRENFESWGRKKRDVSKRSVESELDTAMSLSREIIVLDFGDEATSPYESDTPQPANSEYRTFLQQLCFPVPLFIHLFLSVHIYEHIGLQIQTPLNQTKLDRNLF